MAKRKNMKKIVAVATAFIATVSFVSAAPTIYVVDMGKVYNNYYKAKEAMSQINASVENTNQELQKMNKQREDLIKEINAIQEKVNNPALTEDAKKKIVETEAQPKILQARRVEADMENIRNQAAQRLQQNARSIRQVHMQEILKVVSEIAAAKKADFIIEKTAALFSKPEADITEDVIKAVNASDPAAAKK